MTTINEGKKIQRTKRKHQNHELSKRRNTEKINLIEEGKDVMTLMKLMKLLDVMKLLIIV